MSQELSEHASILLQPGILALHGNRPFATDSGAQGVSIRQQPSGHFVYYGPHGRRILLTDPDGHPLHECEWKQTSDGTLQLVAARLFLDWGQWVGIKPSGLVNATTLDLSSRPGWQSLTCQDLRMMASRAMGMPLEEVEFFYADDDLIIDPTGRATIRQRKDAFYMLEQGQFEGAKFLSCMSAMNWERVDYLPVVELFKSLLPGTGSATFELIRGLYDDQNPHLPTPLHYRGIPTYPSEAAFGLFSHFFTASFSGKESPFAVFMDTPRSHEVSWLPNATPPLRYVDSAQHVCVTVKQGKVLKVTLMTDSSGLPFAAPNQQGFAPCARIAEVRADQLILRDQENVHEIPLNPKWGVAPTATSPCSPNLANSWRDVFPEGAPAVTPDEAFAAVLFYPEDDSCIHEFSSQPFVADYLDDLMEHDEKLARYREQCTQLLLHGFDASIGTCLQLDRPRTHTIVYSHPALAQKQAQTLWNLLARMNRLRWLPSFRFLPDQTHGDSVYQESYDMMYVWVPFSQYGEDVTLKQFLGKISNALTSQGLAFVAGPESLPALLPELPLNILFGERVSDLQPFKMHQSILPKAHLHPRLHVWALQKL